MTVRELMSLLDMMDPDENVFVSGPNEGVLTPVRSLSAELYTERRNPNIMLQYVKIDPAWGQ
jgi:hypothetical protein